MRRKDKKRGNIAMMIDINRNRRRYNRAVRVKRYRALLTYIKGTYKGYHLDLYKSSPYIFNLSMENMRESIKMIRFSLFRTKFNN